MDGNLTFQTKHIVIMPSFALKTKNFFEEKTGRVTRHLDTKKPNSKGDGLYSAGISYLYICKKQSKKQYPVAKS